MTENQLRLSAKPSHQKDGFSTLHYVGYLEQEPLRSAFEVSLEGLVPAYRLAASEIEYRAHVCNWAYQTTRHLSGDILSFGVHYGILEKTVAELCSIDQSNGGIIKNFYLFDTWGPMLGGHEGYLIDVFPDVYKRFAKYEFVKMIRGLVPESFVNIEINQVSLLMIDMNGWKAELAVLNSFYEKVVCGGVIYFDDYGWNYPELREVVDNFLLDKPERLLHFASGNAILIKQ
jgi:hypothetical protein